MSHNVPRPCFDLLIDLEQALHAHSDGENRLSFDENLTKILPIFMTQFILRKNKLGTFKVDFTRIVKGTIRLIL